MATNKQDEEAITAGKDQEENKEDQIREELDEVSYIEEDESIKEGFDIAKMLIISHGGMFSMTWTFFDILCCLASSYVYIWLATFGEVKSGEAIMTLSVAFELVFAFSILTRFLTDYTPDGETEPVKSLSKISTRYLHSDFIWDILPLIPLPFIFNNIFGEYYAKLLYMIKCIRLLNGFKLFNVSLMLASIKKWSQKRMIELIKTKPELAENMDIDNNQIENLMMVNYGLKTFKLIIIIINISFFLGMFWLIFCDVTMRITENY